MCTDMYLHNYRPMNKRCLMSVQLHAADSPAKSCLSHALAYNQTSLSGSLVSQCIYHVHYQRSMVIVLSCKLGGAGACGTGDP